MNMNLNDRLDELLFLYTETELSEEESRHVLEELNSYPEWEKHLTQWQSLVLKEQDQDLPDTSKLQRRILAVTIGADKASAIKKSLFIDGVIIITIGLFLVMSQKDRSNIKIDVTNKVTTSKALTIETQSTNLKEKEHLLKVKLKDPVKEEQNEVSPILDNKNTGLAAHDTAFKEISIVTEPLVEQVKVDSILIVRDNIVEMQKTIKTDTNKLPKQLKKRKKSRFSNGEYIMPVNQDL